MNKHYPNGQADVCLITTSEINLGVRALSSFLKEKGYAVALGFFDSWGLYTDEELASIRAWVRSLGPKVIGVSAIEFSREKTLQLMAALKDPGRPLVAGGADATLNPEVYLEHAAYVVRGEGEEATAELVDALVNGKRTEGIRNLGWKEGGQVRVNPVRPLIQELDRLPFEDWLDIERHFELAGGKVARKTRLSRALYDQVSEHFRAVYLMTIRGCSFGCTFCVNSEIKRLNPGERLIRKRSVLPVINEVERLKQADPSISNICFFDDDFFLHTPDEIRAFAEEWKRRIRLPFYVNCTPLTITEEKLRDLLDAGLTTITMGVQTGSERTGHEIYDRKMRNADVVAASRLIRRYLGAGAFGLLPPTYDFIINNPYESADDLMGTVRICTELAKPYCAQMHSLKLFQGTHLYRKAQQDGLVAGKDEMTKYNCHDTLKHFETLVRRGGNFYLNSLLYWMNGFHTAASYGVVPAKLLGFLTDGRVVGFFNRHPRLTSLLNGVLPTQKRIYNFKDRIRKYLGG